jgi:hypothetical protein
MCANGSDDATKLKLEAYRLSERMLEMEVSIATASDQRAIAFCGVVVAGAAILAGLFDANLPNFGLLVSSMILAVSAGFAGYAARPVKLYTPGAWYEDFADDISRQPEDFMKAVVEMAVYNDSHSRVNKAIIERNAKFLNKSYVISIVGLLVAIVSQFVSAADFGAAAECIRQMRS